MSNSQQSSYLSKQEKLEGAHRGGGLLSGDIKGGLISGRHKRGIMSGGLISGRHKKGVRKGGAYKRYFTVCTLTLPFLKFVFKLFFV